MVGPAVPDGGHLRHLHRYQRSRTQAFREVARANTGVPASTTQTTADVPGPRLKAPPYGSPKSSAAVSSESGKSNQAVPTIPM